MILFIIWLMLYDHYIILEDFFFSLVYWMCALVGDRNSLNHLLSFFEFDRPVHFPILIVMTLVTPQFHTIFLISINFHLFQRHWNCYKLKHHYFSRSIAYNSIVQIHKLWKFINYIWLLYITKNYKSVSLFRKLDPNN